MPETKNRGPFKQLTEWWQKQEIPWTNGNRALYNMVTTLLVAGITFAAGNVDWGQIFDNLTTQLNDLRQVNAAETTELPPLPSSTVPPETPYEQVIAQAIATARNTTKQIPTPTIDEGYLRSEAASTAAFHFNWVSPSEIPANTNKPGIDSYLMCLLENGETYAMKISHKPVKMPTNILVCYGKFNGIDRGIDLAGIPVTEAGLYYSNANIPPSITLTVASGDLPPDPNSTPDPNMAEDVLSQTTRSEWSYFQPDPHNTYQKKVSPQYLAWYEEVKALLEKQQLFISQPGSESGIVSAIGQPR